MNNEFADAITIWQLKEGRHNLPWQKDITAYRVWLSETMLQQTQVKTVIPYFTQFIEKYPTISDLAHAPEDDVMKLWAGLGYYSRARNLHQTAKIISGTHNNHFPSNYEDIIKLPGIGRSTAGAILSLAFNESYPILDGNVKRIFARINQYDQPLNQAKSLNQLWQFAEASICKKNPKAYNQGLMDLGAIICTKNKPSCLICPINTHCQAFKNNTQSNYPIKNIKKSKPTKTQSFLVIHKNNKIIIKKQPKKGIWGGLYSLPSSDDYANISNQKPTKQTHDFIHHFTHFKLIYHFKFYHLEVSKLNKTDQLIDRSFINQFAFPKPIKVFLESSIFKI